MAARYFIFPAFKATCHSIFPALKVTRHSIFPALKVAFHSIFPALKVIRRSIFPALKATCKSIFPAIKLTCHSIFPGFSRVTPFFLPLRRLSNRFPRSQMTCHSTFPVGVSLLFLRLKPSSGLCYIHLGAFWWLWKKKKWNKMDVINTKLASDKRFVFLVREAVCSIYRRRVLVSD